MCFKTSEVFTKTRMYCGKNMKGRCKMSQITGEKVSLKKLFSDEFFFSIPEYQRPYSWKREQCEQLFDDIDESNRDNEYFMGTIILQEIGSIGSGIKYDIIDGQQRITTLQILLACLRDRVENNDYKISTQSKIYQRQNPADGIPEKVRLEVKEKNFFKKYVQKENGTSKSEIDAANTQNDSQLNLLNAIKIFKDKLLELSQHQINSLIEHISQRCVVMYVSTQNFDDAYRLFTIINDRGLQLRRIDILKANNLEPGVITNAEERTWFANIWENIENDLCSSNFEKLISFIRTIEIKEKAKDDILKEYNKLVFEKNKILRGKDFIEYLNEYKNIYQTLILDKDIYEKDDEYKIISIPYKNLLNIMDDFLPSNDWIPPILYFYKRFGKQKMLNFVQKLENKFVADWILGATATKRVINMNAILRKIEQCSNIDELLASEVLSFNKSEYKDRLLQDIYEEDYIKYILLKLEYIESEQNVERRYGTLSVEHVLPQKPNSNSSWLKDFNNEERILWTNKLSNLVLLSKRKNSSASNLEFNAKKEKYIKGRITDLGRSQKLLSYSEWTPIILEIRQKQIIEQLLK